MDQLVRIPLVPRGKKPLVYRWQALEPESPIWGKTAEAVPGCNWGLRLDRHLVVDCDSPEAVRWWEACGTETPYMLQGRPDRRSFWYSLTEECACLRPGRFMIETDLKFGPGHQMAVPPSIHPQGHAYAWLGPPVDEDAAPPPAPVDVLVAYQHAHHEVSLGEGWDRLEEGVRDDGLTSFAGFLRRRGATESALRRALLALNAALCVPRLEDAEVEKIAHSIARRPTGPEDLDWGD
jgi:bifunctional DNA primase/polymerase-like protein/primase-like protein